MWPPHSSCKAWGVDELVEMEVIRGREQGGEAAQTTTPAFLKVLCQPIRKIQNAKDRALSWRRPFKLPTFNWVGGDVSDGEGGTRSGGLVKMRTAILEGTPSTWFNNKSKTEPLRPPVPATLPVGHQEVMGRNETLSNRQVRTTLEIANQILESMHTTVR